jgi:DNA-binding LacI/PurR family transcriptional regulator
MAQEAVRLLLHRLDAPDDKPVHTLIRSVFVRRQSARL